MIVDRVAEESDESIDFAVFDREMDHLLADTSNNHDPNLLYNSDAMLDNTTFDVEMMDEGIVEDEDFLVSSATVVADDETGSKVVSWIVQVRQPTEIASAPLDNIREVSADVASTRSLISLGLMSLLVLALFIAFRAARRIATRITGPITALSIQAQAAASEGIPLIVEAAEQSEEDLPGSNRSLSTPKTSWRFSPTR